MPETKGDRLRRSVRERRDHERRLRVELDDARRSSAPRRVRARLRAAVMLAHRKTVKAEKRLANFRRARRRPRIITARQIGLSFQWVFGEKGTPFRVAGHYTAGPRARNAAELAAEMRKDHGIHAAQGWGGLAYDYMVADDGTIGLGNPIRRKGAHVAGNNTGNVGISCPATTGDRPTEDQARSLRWLLANAHTRALPAEHRSPVDLRRLILLGHKEFPGNATACPGLFIDMYHAKGAAR